MRATKKDVDRAELRATIPEDSIARFVVDAVVCPFCDAAKGIDCALPTRVYESGVEATRKTNALNRDATGQHVQRVKAAGREAIRRLVSGERPIEGRST